MGMVTLSDIGIIGLGRMGRPMGSLIARNGFTVRGFDPNPRASESAASAGIETMKSCREVAERSDAILLIVGFGAQLEESVFGESGVLVGVRPGTILIVGSTVAPGYMKDLARRATVAGLQVVDAPVARGEAAARSGTLLVFAGGDRQAFDAALPVLQCFAERIDYLGPAGAGQTAKAINNMLLWTCLCANVEGLDFGEASGLNREALREALRHSSGANWALETRADERPALWAEKDMDLLLAEAEAAGIAMPVSETVREAIAAFKAARGLPNPKME